MERSTDPRRVWGLEGGRNFRDLGGYQTADGRRVRWGRVFRSGVLTYLTDRDHEQLAPLDIRAIIDLRTRSEREREPTHWRDARTQQLAWDYDPRFTSLQDQLDQGEVQKGELSLEVLRTTMARLYQRLPERLAPLYRQLFEQLAKGQGAVVFHCSVGKDRTGIAAALILEVLGVPRPLILEDYALTNTCVDLEAHLQRHHAGSVGVGDGAGPSLFRSLSPERRRPLLAAEPQYLSAALDAIDSEHGSVEGYCRRGLGLDASVVTQVRTKLLDGS